MPLLNTWLVFLPVLLVLPLHPESGHCMHGRERVKLHPCVILNFLSLIGSCSILRVQGSSSTHISFFKKRISIRISCTIDAYRRCAENVERRTLQGQELEFIELWRISSLEPLIHPSHMNHLQNETLENYFNPACQL